jgi:CubicO group peptidase (beta-lactamase class C family)
LIEYAIERVSGKSYADVLRDEVFLPLGLTESSVKLTPDLDDRGAVRYWEFMLFPSSSSSMK